MKYRDLIGLIEEIAPTDMYRDFDNSGEQICCGREDVERVLLCLEINEAVMDEAEEKDVHMIITHHPLIFNPPKKIDYDDFPGRYIHRAIKKGISVYSAHLSFDFAPGGNNNYLAELLKLTSCNRGSMEEGYYGMLPEKMSFEAACDHVERCLDLPKSYIRCVDGGREGLLKVGLCTGAGGDYIFKAAAEGCDLFITGDVKLHEAQYAKAFGMSVIDAGHYGTEKIFTENMAAQIEERVSKNNFNLEVIRASSNTNPYTL